MTVPPFLRMAALVGLILASWAIFLAIMCGGVVLVVLATRSV